MTSAPLSVRELEAPDIARWDAFVLAAPGGTFFHRAGWKRAIEQGFGHRCHYLLAEADGEIRGVLPLVHQKTLLFGNGLSSTSFCVYGGPLAADAAALSALDAAAIALRDSLGAKYLEYRCQSPQHHDWPAKSDLYATFRRPIVPERDKNLLAIPRKQRAVVRKALEGDLKAEIDDDVGRFFPLYAESVRNLGTPVFARRFFVCLKEIFGDDCEILTILHQERPVAAVMSFYFRDEVLPYYAGGIVEQRRLGAHDFMYFETIARAGERGLKVFDFGRSKQGTGSFAFKKNWGFTPQFLHYEYQLQPGHEVPDVNPLNPKYRLFIALWQRLPLPIANALGPWLARGLG